MTKKSLSVIGVLIVVLGIVYLSLPNQQEQLLHDMVELDRNYIPALSLTSQGKLEPSKVAMEKLIPVWREFKNKYHFMERHDVLWKRDMDKVNNFIDSAYAIVKNGHDLNDAHEELEKIRFIMMGARDRNHIDYYVDKLNRFHEPMENLVLAVKGKNADKLTEQTVVSMRSELKTAQYLWEKVVNSQFIKEEFGFDESQAKKLARLKETESMALIALEEALDSGNKTAIIQAAKAIKPPYAKMYMMFGGL